MRLGVGSQSPLLEANPEHSASLPTASVLTACDGWVGLARAPTTEKEDVVATTAVAASWEGITD